MLKKCVSLPIETDEKINEFMQLNKMKNYSQSITKLIEIGFESFKKKNTVLDIYQKLDHIDLQNRYIVKLIEQFYSDMEVDGGTNPKESEALKMFWAKRIKDPFNE